MALQSRKFNSSLIPVEIENNLIDYEEKIQAVRERSLFMAGMGNEEKVLHTLKKILPHHLLESNFLYPTKENSKTRVHLCLNMVYVFTLPL